MSVWPAAAARVKEEVADMKAIAAKEEITGPFEPWDYLYFAEKLRAARYDLNQAEIKPYFELNNMVAAAMWSAERSYGIVFTEITGRIPVYHPDVRVWEAKDGTGARLGLLWTWNSTCDPRASPILGRSSTKCSSGSECRMKSRCVTDFRTSSICSPPSRTRRGTTAISGQTSWPPTRGRRSWKRAVRGTRRSPRDSASTSLTEGNATDRAEAYRRFRGRNPDAKALFEERGF
jgi:hypothetical protein